MEPRGGIRDPEVGLLASFAGTPRVFLLAWFVAMACDQPADTGLPGGVHFLARDSAGVVVATTLGTHARAPVGWMVDAVPVYQVGMAEGEEPYLFTRIQGAQQLSDGGVVVLDRASCELRFFGPDADFLLRAGGKGEGPGELDVGTGNNCHLVPTPGNDSLVAYDGRRLSFFDEQGRFSHRLPVSWHGRRRVPRVRSVVGQRVLVADRFLAMTQTGDRGLPREPSTADFGLLEIDGWRPVWEGSWQGLQFFRFPSRSGGTDWLNPLPFDILPDAALSANGLHLTLGEIRGPEIQEYDFSGRLRRILRLAEPVVEPTGDHLDKLVEFEFDRNGVADSTGERIFDGVRSRYDEMPSPEIMPVFSRLLVDDVGWLWAELYRFDVRQPWRWIVFGPNGEGLGSVDMPPGLTVWQIGQDFVLGVWRDENRVEYVRRHTLTERR